MRFLFDRLRSQIIYLFIFSNDQLVSICVLNKIDCLSEMKLSSLEPEYFGATVYCKAYLRLRYFSFTVIMSLFWHLPPGLATPLGYFSVTPTFTIYFSSSSAFNIFLSRVVFSSSSFFKNLHAIFGNKLVNWWWRQRQGTLITDSSPPLEIASLKSE